ncbi:MAG: hypothetical protein WC071_14270 [Victivallaceae bacterium]
MEKFDKSTGFSSKEIEIIKNRICKNIVEQLPNFPEYIEIELYFASSGAWLFYWKVIDLIPKDGLANKVILEVTVKLKRRFHDFVKNTEFKFNCIAEKTDNIYTPIISTKKIA